MSVIESISNLVKERRLPYSWEIKLQHVLFKDKLDKRLNEVYKTKPVACTPDSETEIHMQTGKRDLAMATLAAKSLLRFMPELAIVIHEDGSFKEADYELTKNHIPNCKIISPAEADEMVKNFPLLEPIRKQFLTRFDLPAGFEDRARSRLQKVFDLHTTSTTNKVVYLDSDTLFLQPPTELMEWIKNDDSLPFHTRPKLPNLTVSQEKLDVAFPSVNVIPAFNSGFFGFRKSQLDDAHVAKITQKLLDHREVEVLGDESVWRFIYSAMEMPCQCFDFYKYPLFELKERYNEVKSGKELRYLHFLGKHKHGIYEKVAKKLLAEL